MSAALAVPVGRCRCGRPADVRFTFTRHTSPDHREVSRTCREHEANELRALTSLGRTVVEVTGGTWAP